MQNKLTQPKDSSPPPGPKFKPAGWPTVRRFLSLHRTRFYVLFFVVLSILAGFLSLFIFNLTQPPAQHLTQSDINQAVAQALASATPTPSFESQVYQIVRPSVVSINVSTTTPDGKTESGSGSGVVVDDSGTILTCFLSWRMPRR